MKGINGDEKMDKSRNALTKQIWQESEWVATAASENDQGFPLETYLKQPDKINLTLTKVSSIAAKRLVASLKKQLVK
jgi:hypothetical protein